MGFFLQTRIIIIIIEICYMTPSSYLFFSSGWLHWAACPLPTSWTTHKFARCFLIWSLPTTPSTASYTRPKHHSCTRTRFVASLEFPFALNQNPLLCCRTPVFGTVVTPCHQAEMLCGISLSVDISFVPLSYIVEFNKWLFLYNPVSYLLASCTLLTEALCNSCAFENTTVVSKDME